MWGPLARPFPVHAPTGTQADQGPPSSLYENSIWFASPNPATNVAERLRAPETGAGTFRNTVFGGTRSGLYRATPTSVPNHRSPPWSSRIDATTVPGRPLALVYVLHVS